MSNKKITLTFISINFKLKLNNSFLINAQNKIIKININTIKKKCYFNIFKL